MRTSSVEMIDSESKEPQLRPIDSIPDRVMFVKQPCNSILHNLWQNAVNSSIHSSFNHGVFRMINDRRFWFIDGMTSHNDSTEAGGQSRNSISV